MDLMYGIVKSESGTILMEQSVIQTHVFSTIFSSKAKRVSNFTRPYCHLCRQ